MKTSKVKWEIIKALDATYKKAGFTSTAAKFTREIFKRLDKLNKT